MGWEQRAHPGSRGVRLLRLNSRALSSWLGDHEYITSPLCVHLSFLISQMRAASVSASGDYSEDDIFTRSCKMTCKNRKCLGKWLAHRRLSGNACYYSENLALTQACGNQKDPLFEGPGAEGGSVGTMNLSSFAKKVPGWPLCTSMSSLANKEEFHHAEHGGISNLAQWCWRQTAADALNCTHTWGLSW